MRADELHEGDHVNCTSLREGWVKEAVVVEVENERTAIVKLVGRNQNVFRIGVGFLTPLEKVAP